MSVAAVPVWRVTVGEVVTEAAPDLWGIFLEDINASLDGGINAELVRNGDFEFEPTDGRDLDAWTGWERVGVGHADIRVEDPVHPHNRHYARLTGPVQLTNSGFDGMRIEPGRSYRLTLATWALSDNATIEVSIVDGDRILAAGTLEVPRHGWTWQEMDLTPQVGAPTRGRLKFEVPTGFCVEIDVVSLRQVDDDGRALTFRPDLVETLAAMQPSFVRFPGGCVAHGIGLDNLYHWKDTVGPRAARRQTFNAWGYHQSRQIGYLEYFELCERLDASPMPVVAAGVCCQNLRGGARAIPREEMAAYVQDVLDLIEFANGGMDTPWGARRAAMGHPEPFSLRYLGVGNEDEITDEFRGRYAQIEDAVRRHYPDVVVIGTSGPWPSGADFEAGWAFARQRGVEVVDEHAYRNPRWFHQNVERYLDYPLEGPDVYVGEYAARSSTVRSALAEAAFMIGMERSPVVRLASYAPLLARLGDTQWVPDLIYFDGEGVTPSASYYVQAMFGAHRGEHVHSVTCQGADPVPVMLAATGSARLRSSGAQFEICDVMLNGEPVPDAVLDAHNRDATLGDIAPGAATLELVATRRSGEAGLVIELGGDGRTSRLDVELGSWSGFATVVSRCDDGLSHNDDGPLHWSGFRTGVPVHIRIELTGPQVRVFLDGELRHDYTQDMRAEHRLVAGALSRRDAGVDETVIRLVNATEHARCTEIGGAPWTTGVGLVLGGVDPDAGEPFVAAPAHPEALTVAVADGAATVELPPWSFAVIILRGSQTADTHHAETREARDDP